MKSLIAILFFPIFIFAQQKDTIATKLLPDSIKLSNQSTSLSDSTKKSRKTDVDAIVLASAQDSLVYNVKNKKMFLFNKAELKYKTTDLKSGKIFVDYDRNELEAFGIEDTSDTAKVKLKQTPVLAEGADIYEGSRIKYNFRTQQGFISLAKNREEASRYEGEKVKKVDKNTYFIENGMFTTCEEDNPHTHFTASEMKVIQRDKIIAKWIFMYIGGVPFPIPLPFAVIPNESGRRSGIIIPTYGQEFRRGQYFRNFGYFFALSDYFDLALTGDYFTKGGYGLRGRLRYAKRYDFSGSFNAGYSRITLNEEGDPDRTEETDWNFSLFHNQQIDPTSRLDVNLQFQSKDFFRNNSISYNDLLTQDIISNATYSKRWEESGNSLSINYSRTQNLSNGNIYESLPNIYFSNNITYPFKRESSESITDQKWYEMIALTYSGQFRNERRKTEGNLRIRGGVQHNLAVSASPKLGYFNVSPNISYQERWYNKRIKTVNQPYDLTDSSGKVTRRDSLITTDEKGLFFVRTFDIGVTASTKLYGIMQPNILGIQAFRHTLMPSISYNYKPDFGSDSWGYYDSYTKINGQIERYDKYGSEVFGGAGRGESQSLTFSLGNVFEMKTMVDPNDTTKNSDANKIQLLNVNASVGYNFAADSLKLSDLSLDFRTQIGQSLNLSSNSTFTFYDYVGTQRINRFLASAGKGLLRLSSFSFSVSTNLIGKAREERKTTPRKTESDYDAFQKKDYISVYDENGSPDLSIPWNLNLSYNYNLSKFSPSEVTTYSNLSADLGFSITKNWKFSVRGSYDFDRKEVIAPQITIYRDLHCWEMNFTWNPIGTYRGFMFEIRMKAPELQDIKVSKSRGLYSGRR